MSKFIKGAFLCAALCLSPSVAFADESSSTTVEANTPLGTSSTSIERKSDATGSATAVKKTRTDLGGSRSTTFRAKAGPDGAKVSKTKQQTSQNADGSLTASKTHESHEVNAAGSVHKRAAANTTVNADGSTVNSKSEATTTNP